jgi:PIN domain nuclease of toxin-antitoxin system
MDIVAAQKLPHHHADPFDRMLIAQARTFSLTLVTKDSKIALYEVDILWA